MPMVLKEADLHNHTKASHGENSVREMYAAAGERNLRYMGFAEHSPLPPGIKCNLYTGDLPREFPVYASQVMELKNESAGPIPLLGIELDWIPSQYEWMLNLVGNWSFDHVIGSVHYVDGYSISNLQIWQEWPTIQERFGRFKSYYSEMASMAASGLIDIASHPDFIKLRVYDDFHLWVERPESRDYIMSALESMAAHDVAMEVNAAGLRRHPREPYPCPHIMRMAKDAGVKITFGSDAHKREEVGQDISLIHDYASSFGFERHLVFVNRQPLEFSI